MDYAYSKAASVEEGHILVVDDNHENLRILVQLLTDAGYRVHAATKGSLALTRGDLTLADPQGAQRKD